MQQKLQSLKTNFLFFLELQLLISVVILPILIAWGLPISMMTILGNLVFAQFLTAFIFVSALLFVSDLFGIPNHYIELSLEWISQIWHYFLSFGSAHWLVGFSYWIFPISFICAIAGCNIYYLKMKSQNYRIITLIILCLTTPIIHTVFQNRSIHTTLRQGNQKMHIIKHNGKIYAFDLGALGARQCSQSWVEYTLAPAMVKILGATHIDCLILCKSNSRTKKAAQDLMQHIPTSQLIEIKNQQTCKFLKIDGPTP
jgi:hypothetical protein